MQHIKTIILSHKMYTAVIVVMVLSLLARIPLGTFNAASPLDVLAHFVLPAAGAPLAAVFVEVTGIMTAPNKRSFIVLAGLLGITAEALWEIVEYGVDTFFHLGWQLGNGDTMNDIMLAVVGSIVGSLLFVALYRSSKTNQ